MRSLPLVKITFGRSSDLNHGEEVTGTEILLISNTYMKMACKLDQQKIKHQLFHLSISLATVIGCMTYLKYRNNWVNVGKLWESLIVPAVFVAEVLKVVLSRYYGQQELNSQKFRHRSSTSFMPKDILDSLLVQILSVALYAFICVVLGAPIQELEQTFVLALLLTLTTVSPAVFLLGGSGSLQVCFCEKPEYITTSDETALDLFKYNAAGAIFGAWAASVVAPLDWDRDWQVYPIPNVIGALLGTALGNIYACWRVLHATATIYLTMRRI